MSAAPQRGIAGLAIITAIMVATLTSLGVWQLQRRAQKHALIAALTERLAASPVELPPQSQWASLDPARDEFRRVRFVATFANKPDAMVYGAGSALRSDISGPGVWAFLPAKLPASEGIVVNAGFVPNTIQDRAQQDRACKDIRPQQQHRSRDVGAIRVTQRDRRGDAVLLTRGFDEIRKFVGAAAKIVLVEHALGKSAEEARHAVLKDFPPRR